MSLGYGEETGGKVELDGTADFDALLMSRLDFEVRVLDIPPVPERDIEGLIGLRLRSVYPGNPRDTAFDYRIVSRGAGGRAVVFVCRRSTVEAYRGAAGRRPLLLPYLLVSHLAPKKGGFRVWVWAGRWAEHLVFDDGALVSSTVRRLARGKSFELAREEERLKPEERTGRLLVVARQDQLPSLSNPGGADVVALESVGLPRRFADGIFAGRRARALPGPAVRLTLLAAAVIVLGLAAFFRLVRAEEAYDGRLRAFAGSLQKSNQAVLAVRKEAEDLAARAARLSAGQPRDAYQLLSDLSAVLGDNVRLRTLTLSEDSFQLQAVGENPLKLMEAFASRPSFSGMRLSQVVPDPRTGMELFSISGVYRAR